ncbi:ABC transporter ATP-binding protein [Carnobacterium divergens]|uniref:ABC transporter ATP-binding protein YfiB n=1 Tax=Carnobacterium divergens DSM 20623 TaxID=1449336 RepID=A0A0R2I3I5_CARDV|nr:ABC transporter ATP-binding protein [Carnobacterium divergens]KRN56378.1 ABC transporter ATP-binding protein YfiB [Carnobacterium divergens DSM 20623]MDO0875029.1 ABC transporter ATP-binding protein/permease [Carnobacterium divergens]SUX18023.1 Lipid A export ATP-binding/permease protein MsbA [Carnobacterium divergens]
MKLVIDFFKKNKRLSSATVVALLFQILGTLGVPLLVAKLIDEGIASGDPILVYEIGLQMVGVAFFAAISAIIGSYLSAQMAASFGYQIRNFFFRKVQKLSLKDTEEFGVASLVNRTSNDVDNIQQVMILFLQMILPGPIISIVAIYMTYSLSPKLTIVPILSMLIFLMAVFILMKKSNPYSRSVQMKMDQVTRVFREFFMGISVIRAFGNQEYEKKRTDQTFKEYADNTIKLNQVFAWLTPTVLFLMGSSLAGILWIGGNEVALGKLQIGSITAVAEYTIITLAYLVMAAMVIVTIPKGMASVYRIQELLTKEPEVKDLAIVNADSQKNQKEVVAFKNVTFSYQHAAEPVLQNISFVAKRGEVTAIVGGTGSGKSTIAKVLLRFSEITSGEILLNGLAVHELSQFDLRKKISYVPQKAYLFSGTIEENLKTGNQTISSDELEHIIKIAQSDSFIHSLEKGIQSKVAQGGSNFSGGQKQRLAIARALAKQADVYVFDDSFSALDFKTDSRLRQALKEELKNKAVIIVAQRISTIKDADQILVLDEGVMVGKGTHTELLETNPIYQEFVASQSASKETQDDE